LNIHNPLRATTIADSQPPEVPARIIVPETEGYLFLLIDFNEQFPQIYIRAWQPQEWNTESLIDLGNFNLNR
jgi:hypothetical protein